MNEALRPVIVSKSAGIQHLYNTVQGGGDITLQELMGKSLSIHDIYVFK